MPSMTEEPPAPPTRGCTSDLIASMLMGFQVPDCERSQC
jgi:hypothetical protein